MASTLPTFSRGLKLVRLGIIVMLLQIVAMIVVQVLGAMADSSDQAEAAIRNFKYVMLVGVLAAGMMAFGVARALPELKRAGMDLTTLAISAVGFVIATAALAWSYHLLTSFIDAVQSLAGAAGRDSSPEHVEEVIARAEAAAERFEGIDKIAVLKDLAYGAGLYFLTRTIQSSAALNDQLALRDRAGSMGRAVMVMVVGDLFYQLTYGLGNGGVGFTGLIATLSVAGYWIWCHVKLQRFLFDAAWFVNEPHNLPMATAIVRAPAPKAPAEPSRPSMPVIPQAEPPPRPSQSMPIVVAPPPIAPTPRAESASESGPELDGPRFLR